jgi:RNA polymerase sigma factor (TIGR02999 family)
MAPPDSDATLALRGAEAGEPGAAERLLPLVYGELRELAARLMREQRPDHTLQPTALVHEAYVRLIEGSGRGPWTGRAHFVRVAARAMRNVLVDHARSKGARKRTPGSGPALALDAAAEVFAEAVPDLVALDEALARLERLDEPLARIVELRFFAGLSIADTARVLGVSTPTVERGWRTARMWLRCELPEPE